VAEALGKPRYIVRRLTPLECCRLQGFPDWWATGIATADPTDGEIDEWSAVFEAHRQATNPKGKPKTRSQVKKWLQNPRSDSAEYKMWGNSLALPNAYNVLQGIADELREERRGGTEQKGGEEDAECADARNAVRKRERVLAEIPVGEVRKAQA
jgi:hypothetical protein